MLHRVIIKMSKGKTKDKKQEKRGKKIMKNKTKFVVDLLYNQSITFERYGETKTYKNQRFMMSFDTIEKLEDYIKKFIDRKSIEVIEIKRYKAITTYQEIKKD